MTRYAPISDPDGDIIAAQETADRALERADSPLLHLGPLDPCRDCDTLARETSTGQWSCACEVAA